MNNLSSFQIFDLSEPMFDNNDLHSLIFNDDDFSEYVKILEEIYNERNTNLTQSSSKNIDKITSEISFDQTEWLIHDLSTEKLRPPKVHEFLYLLLKNSRYSSYTSWLNEQGGLFEIHKPNEITKLWAKVKIQNTNTEMNFDKFSRSIRSLYTTGIMISTRKKYTYRFAIHQ